MAASSWYAVLQYAGGGFAGWQRQPHDRTVQAEIEAVLERLEGTHVTTHAAGRTDAGVHALGQVISCRLARAWTPPDLARALNALLPPDIWVARIGVAPDGFHARKHARARCYRYVVGCDAASASPFRRNFEWALGRPLDATLLARAAAAFAGEHDFRAFSAVGQVKPHYRCVVSRIEWRPRDEGTGYILDIESDRFLHRMVRFVVGASVDVALGRRPLDDIPRLLAGTDNREASPPALPEGLYLVTARYDNLELEREDHPCSSSSTPRT
jgi:tRNA pseudouridine38-40 synthase